jgi:hypothetical protein
VTFSEDMDETTVNAADFGLSGTAGGSIGTVTEVAPRFFEVQVTPATAGTLQLQINQGAPLSDPAGNSLDTGTALLDNTVITVETDNTDPTLATTDIVDDQSGGTVNRGTTVTYTLTFSEDMNHTTIDAADFGNNGTATFTLGAITEVSANVFQVQITPDSTGTLQLEVLDTAVIADAAGNLLDVTDGIAADTSLTVEPGPLGVTRLRVFLLGGQSNALGSNQIEPSELPAHLQLPREDIPYYHQGNNVIGGGNPYERVIGLQPVTRFGPEITMGRGLADGLADGVNTQVAIIKYARGATNLYENWKAGGDNTWTGDGAAYESFQISVTEGLAALAAKYPNAIIEIEGMLWVQGEWDALELSNAQNYETNLTNFIADIRLTYGTDLPFVISRLSSGQTYINATSLATVQAAQDAVAAADPLASVFNTDSFELFNDNLHFNETGQQQIGDAASVQLLDFLNVPTPPQISSLTPAHLSSGHLPTDNLSITFDENVAFGTGNITIRQDGGAHVETYDVTNPGANLSLSGDTLTINPTGDLNTFTTYYVEIDNTAIEDLDGAAFAGISGDGTWRFTTGEPDTTDPQIQTLSPTHGALDIAIDTNLTITFTEDVVFDIGSIVLRENGGSAVETFDVGNPPAGLTLNGATVTINPSNDLALGTTYYVEIPATAIDDLAGNPFDGISGSGTWSFTTIPPDTTAPTAQTLSPTNGEDNIGTSANLTITFSEDIAYGMGNVFLYENGVVDPVQTFDVENPGSGLSISGATLTINPTGDLDTNTTYYIEIGNTAIEDLAGNPYGGISGSSTWSFTTSDPASTILFDFQNDLTSDIAEGAVAVNDLSSPVNGNGVTLTASVGNLTSASRDRGANTGPNSDITRDFIQWQIATPITITISGLVADQEYSFRLWSGDLAGNQIKTTDHTIAGASGGDTIRHTSVSLADENTTGGSLIEFPNVVSTSTGTLTYTIDYVGGGGTAATLNGFELVVIGSSADTFTDYIADPAFGLAPADQGIDLDPDKDGSSNGKEAFFGTHPGEASRGLSAGAVVTGGTPTFTFTHPVNDNPPSDLSATYIWSKDLKGDFYADGIENEGTTVTFVAGDPDENNIVTVTATINGTSVNKLFVDVFVELQ